MTDESSVTYTVKELVAQVLERLDLLDDKLSSRLETLSESKADRREVATAYEAAQGSFKSLESRIVALEAGAGAAAAVVAYRRWLLAGGSVGAIGFVISMVLALSHYVH